MNLFDPNIEGIDYWIYSPCQSFIDWYKCCRDGIMTIDLNESGDTPAPFSDKETIERQFEDEIERGDVIIAKKDYNSVFGYGVIISDAKHIESDSGTKSVRYVHWIQQGIWSIPGCETTSCLKNITRYTGYIAKLKDTFSETKIIPEFTIYTRIDFLNDVYNFDSLQYYDIVNLITTKHNIILQGAPGVGKSYIAQKLACSIVGWLSSHRIEYIQFHQSYSYEDFIEGYRPTESGFELRKGVFYNFCKKAEADAEHAYILIIDEINRGNLSKIFGELFMLIESDKRGQQMRLLYSDEMFSVPENVYIIGMMNTADRSLAMLDYALRRRFAFVTINPAFDSDGFIKYQKSLANAKFNRLIDCVKELNAAIAADDALGEGFCIGHSYFCNIQPDSQPDLSFIVEYEILPLISEYWFDDRPTVNKWADRLRGAIR